MPNISSADIATATVPHDCRLRRIGWVYRTATSGGSSAVLTIRRNNTAIGDTFTTVSGNASAGDGGVHEVGVLSTAYEFKAGDQIGLLSDAGPTSGGEVFFTFEMEQTSGAHSDVVLTGYMLVINNANARAQVEVPFPCRMSAVTVALDTATTGNNVITIQKNGTDTSQTFTVPATTAGLGAKHDLPPSSELEFEAGDVIGFESAGGGGGAVAFFGAVLSPTGPANIHASFCWMTIGNTESTYHVATRRCRVAGISAGMVTALDAGTSEVSIWKNGTDTGLNIDWVSTIAIGAGAGHYEGAVGLLDSDLQLESGDVIQLASDGAGANGFTAYNLLLREAA